MLNINDYASTNFCNIFVEKMCKNVGVFDKILLILGFKKFSSSYYFVTTWCFANFLLIIIV